MIYRIIAIIILLMAATWSGMIIENIRTKDQRAELAQLRTFKADFDHLANAAKAMKLPVTRRKKK